ncbi:MAG: DUF4252 domain-containing protein [Bacteroidota bacterium]
MLKLLLIFFSISLFSCQNDSIDDAVAIFSESEYKSYNLHFYPSTMRMVNLNDSPEFNELVKDIEKLEYYTVSEISKDELDQFKSILKDQSYTEMISFQSDGNDVVAFAPEKVDQHEYLILIELQGKYQLARIQGLFNPLKIFELTESFESGEVLDVFSLMETRQNFDGEKRGRRRNRD